MNRHRDSDEVHLMPEDWENPFAEGGMMVPVCFRMPDGSILLTHHLGPVYLSWAFN